MTAYRLGDQHVLRRQALAGAGALGRDRRGRRSGLGLVQHSLDLVDLDADAPVRRASRRGGRRVHARTGSTVHSTFTGPGRVRAQSPAAIPDPDARCGRRRGFGGRSTSAAVAGGRAAGGHVGACRRGRLADAGRRRAALGGLRADLGELAAHARGTRAWRRSCSRTWPPARAVHDRRGRGAAARRRRPAGSRSALPRRRPPVRRRDGGDDRDPYAWLQRLGAAQRGAPAAE